jgi:glutathione S-transferase
VADAYLYTVLGWKRFFSIDPGRWPSIAAYVERVRARASVRAARLAEARTSPVE